MAGNRSARRPLELAMALLWSMVEISTTSGVTMTAALESDLLQISASAADLLFRQARTARAFTDQPVTEEQVRALYDLVRLGPSSMNIQPLRIVVARSEAARATVISHLAEGNRAKSESAPLIAVLAADTEFHTALAGTLPDSAIARFADMDPAKREEYARSQAWLQTGYFVIGVRALGLAAGPIGGYDAEGLDRDLLGGTALRSILVMNIGTPADLNERERGSRLPYETAVVTL
jgi:3-hydroxypropanoate dehydrogenase